LIGGAGVYAYQLTKKLAELGHEIVIFTPSGYEHESNESIARIQCKYVRVSRTLPFRALQFWLNLPRSVRDEERNGRFDVIHFNGISYGFIKRRLINAPHVLTIHHLIERSIKNDMGGIMKGIRDLGSETSPLMPRIEERSTVSADRIIAVSKFTREEIVKRYPAPAERIEVVYNGVEFSQRDVSSAELEMNRDRFGIIEKPTILFVGRTNDFRKGLDVLLKAFELVNMTMDAQLIVAGQRNQDPNDDSSNAPPPNIIYTGFVDDPTLRALYALCDLYVCPSRLEGFGLTILEAYAAGKPVVATAVGAIPELLEHGKNGSLVPTNDPERMAAEIIMFLQNPSLSAAIGQANKEFVHNTFSWGESARRIEKIYEQL
jgi:glycosyltransferase involved in cell wall biosynthesis